MPRNHNQIPVPSTPDTHTEAAISDEVKNNYSVQGIEAWRQSEMNRLSGLTAAHLHAENPFDGEDVRVFKDNIENELDEFLAEKRITADSPDYEAIRQLYRDASIDKYSEDEWGNSPASGGNDPDDAQSQREKVRGNIEQWHDMHDDAAHNDDTDDEPETDEPDTTESEDQPERTLKEIKTELKEARRTWAGLQAKRQMRLWDRRIHGYNEAKDRYTALQDEYISKKLEDTINDEAKSDAEKNEAVIKSVFKEQNKLREKSQEIIKNTKMSKFIEKFGGWLNKGSRWTKFGKGMLVGAGVSVVGAGAGLLLGAAGAGAAIVGGGALAAKAGMRFTRAYAKTDAQQGRGMNTLQKSTREDWKNELSQDGDGETSAVAKALQLSRKTFEDDTQKEKSKRRKTTVSAMGGVAAGVVLGSAGGLLLDHFDVADHLPWHHDTDGAKSAETTKGELDKTKEALQHANDQNKELKDKLDQVTGGDSGDADAGAGAGIDLGKAALDSPIPYSYGEAPENLLQTVAQQHGVELNDKQSDELMRYLMEKTDGKVFKGVDTTLKDGDPFITNPGGETNGFYPDAYKIVMSLKSGDMILPSTGV